tara:strand:- start:1862 stop:2950 length:1089 start_codon:yes stop_codon:yes gene_type:complete
MKYTTKISRKDGGITWFFKPPKDASLAGVVKAQSFRDGRAARYEIPRLLDMIDQYRRGDLVVGSIGPKSNFRQVLGHYLDTKHFGSLSINTQHNYEHKLRAICDTEVFGHSVGMIKVDQLTTPICTEMYDTWEQEVSTDHANQSARIFSVLVNFCVRLDMLTYNPMGRVSKRSHEPRSVIWTHNQVETFLDTAFSDFRYRSIGLLVLMAYEWGQRPIDIRNLKWTSVDLETARVTIKQTKRGATVELPIPDNILTMLIEQKKDWDFQPYVIPHHRPSDRAYVPLSCGQVGQLTNEVKAHAGLPMELRAGDLRKTAIVQLIESGVDQLAIMSVTGHKNVSSLNPYNKHNYKTAKSALDRRKRE